MADKFENNFGGEKSARDIAWELFKKSGDLNYYRLYSSLKNENDEEDV